MDSLTFLTRDGASLAKWILTLTISFISMRRGNHKKYAFI